MDKILSLISDLIEKYLVYLESHKIQGRIITFFLGIAIALWSVIGAIYFGTAIYDLILSSKL